MTDLPETTNAVEPRSSLFAALALAVALLGVALAVVALALVVTGDDTDTVRLPTAMTEQMATMNDHMAAMSSQMANGTMGAMGAMGTMAPSGIEAMRARCVTMMGQLPQVKDAAAFCDSMINTMPMATVSP